MTTLACFAFNSTGLLFLGGGMAILLFLTPWLIGVFTRLNGHELPPLSPRVRSCVTASVAVFFGMCIGVGPGAYAIQYNWPLGVGMLVLGVAGLIVAGFFIMKSCLSNYGLRTRRLIVLVILVLCATALNVRGCGNMQRRGTELARDVINAANMKEVGYTLTLYHDEYGAYPDDLVWVWPPTVRQHWEVTHVLLANDEIRRVSHDELLTKLARTYEWLLDYKNRGTRTGN